MDWCKSFHPELVFCRILRKNKDISKTFKWWIIINWVFYNKRIYLFVSPYHLLIMLQLYIKNKFLSLFFLHIQVCEKKWNDPDRMYVEKGKKVRKICLMVPFWLQGFVWITKIFYQNYFCVRNNYNKFFWLEMTQGQFLRRVKLDSNCKNWENKKQNPNSPVYQVAVSQTWALPLTYFQNWH